MKVLGFELSLSGLQPLGRALMLPIAVLPVAGLLLRLGQPDLLNIAFVAAAGDAIFHNLGLLFAIGVAVGFARDGNGAAGLAGAVCFLVASALAWFEVSHGWGSWQPRSLSWWIPLANLIGSVAFGVSAVAAFVVPATGALLDVELSNLGTFIGALCFLGGALLLLPERTLELE